MTSQKFPTSHTTTFNPQVNWVPQFKGEKYKQWSIQMKSIFIAQGVWDIIQHGYEIPKNAHQEASWDKTKRKSFKLNMRRDHYALSIIHRGVDETILPKIMDAATAKEAWSILEIKYKKLETMENNSGQFSVHVAMINEDVIVSFLQNKEPKLSTKDNCCIYKVPDYLKKGKEECYRPLVASIGPVFYKDPKLETMQKLKLKLLKCFLEHPDNAYRSLQHYLEFVRGYERQIRECYEEQINIPSDEFILMIVLDAASVIFAFLMKIKKDVRPSCNARISSLERSFEVALESLGRDLFVEENQLPFFVLNGMYDIAFCEVNSRLPFKHVALEYIGSLTIKFPGQQAIDSIVNDQKTIKDQKIIDEALSSVKHMVHLRRESCCLPFYTPEKDKGGEQEDLMHHHHHRECCCCLPCYGGRRDKGQVHTLLGDFHEFPSAKQLSSAGVKFKLKESVDLFDITFDKKTGVLRIPKLTLYDDTESALRNILFFEQRHLDYQSHYFANYVTFFDKLIDTVKDIQILQHKGIITNHLGSDEEAKDLFNNLTTNVSISSSQYFAFWEVSRDLKEYASKPWNKWKTIFWSRYFNHPWAIISVVAGVLLIILSILQTITGFFQIAYS